MIVSSWRPTKQTRVSRAVRPRSRGEDGDTRGGCRACVRARVYNLYNIYIHFYVVFEIPFGAEVTRPGIPGRRRRDIINETDFVPISRGIPGTIFTAVRHVSEWRTRNPAAERNASIARRLPPRRTDHGNARVKKTFLWFLHVLLHCSYGVWPSTRTTGFSLAPDHGTGNDRRLVKPLDRFSFFLLLLLFFSSKLFTVSNYSILLIMHYSWKGMGVAYDS